MGRPVFSHGNGRLSHEHSQSEGDSGFFDREVDVNDGSFYWRYNRQSLLDENGKWVRDTAHGNGGWSQHRVAGTGEGEPRADIPMDPSACLFSYLSARNYIAARARPSPPA